METSNQPIVLFTGGGTKGHILPNLPLIESLKCNRYKVAYIGERNGIEEHIVSPFVDSFYSIFCGKFRRYFSLKNITDVIRIVLGILQSIIFVHRIKPSLVFSKGGFVSFPVVVASWVMRVPVIIHESDLTLGLTNKLCLPFAKRLCVAFPSTLEHISNTISSHYTGVPIRAELSQTAAIHSALPPVINLPRLVIFGGSQGARPLNEWVASHVDQLLQHFQVVHILGSKGDLSDCAVHEHYYPFIDILDAFPALLKSADVVMCRSGATTIHELLHLMIPNVLVPLPTYASRGDQLENAEWCRTHRVSEVIYQNDLSNSDTIDRILRTLEQKEQYKTNMIRLDRPDPVSAILTIMHPFLTQARN